MGKVLNICSSCTTFYKANPNFACRASLPSPASGAIYRPLLYNGIAQGHRKPAELNQYFHLNYLFLYVLQLFIRKYL